MLYNDILSSLQILTERARISQKEIAKSLGISKQAVNNRKQRGQHFTDIEIEQIERYFKVDIVDYLQKKDDAKEKIVSNAITLNENTTCPYRLENNCPCREQFNIPYYEDLPEDLKKNDFTSCHIDREIIENYWKYNKDDLRIIPVFTNHLTYYPDERMPFGHICVMDIASTDINKAGVYCFTTNSGIFIRKLNLLLDGSVQFMDYSEPTPKISKTITPEQLENVNFTVIGRVFKCISTRI